MTKIQSIKREREQHHKALEQLARSINPKSHIRGLDLWRKLHRVETTARYAATAYCNGSIDIAQWESISAIASSQVEKIFGMLPTGFFVNGDPRGYALKLASNDATGDFATPFALHRDWGNNQILAPTID